MGVGSRQRDNERGEKVGEDMRKLNEKAYLKKKIGKQKSQGTTVCRRGVIPRKPVPRNQNWRAWTFCDKKRTKKKPQWVLEKPGKKKAAMGTRISTNHGGVLDTGAR